jgi:fumarate reductase flavoprotein subunit
MAQDILICGAGTAGLPCAIAAAEAGAVVTVTEKSAEIGGTLHLSYGHMSAAGARLQREKGIADSTDLHLADVLRIGHGHGDEEIIRLAVEGAAGTIDWLEQIGLDFPAEMPVIYEGHETYVIPRTYMGRELGVSILKAVGPRFEQLVAEGRIRLLLEHALVQLIVSGGAVVGGLFRSPGGDVELRADATVLATGGYAGDPSAFARLNPGVHSVFGGRWTSAGDGIFAAQRLGAAFHGAQHQLPRPGGIEAPFGSQRCDMSDAWAAVNPPRPPREIHVNAAGERFLREDAPHVDDRERALVEQGGKVWLVFDEPAIDEDDPVVIGWSAEMLRDHAARGESAWTAPTLEELARRAGLPAEALARTVEAYNAGVRAGSDALGREHLPDEISTAPFYAVLTQSMTIVTFGGLRADAELRVLRDDGTPIAGLYAIGEVLGGATTMGNAYCGGMCVTPALTLGRLLGARLAGAGAAAGAGIGAAPGDAAPPRRRGLLGRLRG